MAYDEKLKWWTPRRWVRIDEEATAEDYTFQRRMIRVGFAIVALALVLAAVFQARTALEPDERTQSQVAGLVDFAAQAAVLFALFIPIARGIGVLVAGVPLLIAMALDLVYRIAMGNDPGWLLYVIAFLVIVNAIIAGYFARRGEDRRQTALIARQTNQLGQALKLSTAARDLAAAEKTARESLRLRRKWALACGSAFTLAIALALALARSIDRD